MKYYIDIYKLYFIVSEVYLYAQKNEDQVPIFDKLFGQQKMQLINRLINQAGSDGIRFWTIYNAYEKERRALSSERFIIINDYLKSNTSADKEFCKRISVRAFKNGIAYIDLWKKYLTEFSMVMGADSATRFIDMEIYLQKQIKIAIQDAIPFVNEVETIWADTKDGF